MRPNLSFAPLLALTSVVSGLKFTAPNTNDKLNLSAPAINIEWELNNEGNPEYTEMDLSWHGEFAGGGGSFSHTLTENITSSNNQLNGNYSYNWDPTTILESFEKTKNRLSSEKVFYFELRRHAPNSGNAAMEPSEKYAVEGYDLVGSFGTSLKPEIGLGIACLVAVGILV
ncbi:hypothetical protein CkaCkLH20_10052 [Colletotrichum karsti]|uniref:Uncharacterized protein n=1 Tax=Colletotrichum karsti TaxID=1095194 RepID=A0A9P6HYL7_9PEZI|nr:uncharacterized protein CkaCkLH20_10052 [Colletotrichum karsti]KAF9872555.1 hypothetical protein CkaCkLH20_10052 [Colletotrichum karsti]